MSKIALVFSGQGSQYVGMGKDLYDNYDCVKETFSIANEVLDKNIDSMCFEGPEESLRKTENTQTAILTHSIACLRILEENNISFSAVCGFSLGEYSALVASGVTSFKDMLPIVEKRAMLMQSAVENVDSKMSAVIGSTYDDVIDAVGNICEVSNYNSKGQIVIAGLSDKVEEAKLKFSDDIKFVDLNVNGAFHTSVLEKASNEFIEVLKQANFDSPKVKVMSNYTGKMYDVITPEILGKQMSNTVRFYDNVSTLIDEGYDTFIELGPGKVTSSFVKQISREKGQKVTVLNIDDKKSLDKTLKKLGVDND